MNRKIYFKYLLVLALGMLMTACELPNNVDPKEPVEVPVESLFANALRDGLAHIDEMNQNVNVSRLLCQHNSMMWYPDPSRYKFADRQIPDGYWNQFYLVLRDLNEVKRLLSEEQNNLSDSFLGKIANKMAIVDVVEVLMVQNLVDMFGDVPYSEALYGNKNSTPVYDDASTIYSNLQSRLTASITTLQSGARLGSWGAEDLVYGGDVEMWVKFASTLKMRLALRLADVDEATTRKELASAIAAGTLEAGESMQLLWIGIVPHVNTIYNLFVVANRTDYVPSLTIIEIMEALDDARMIAYFSRVNIAWGDEVENLVYLGLLYGWVHGNSYYNYSHFSDAMFAPDFPATISCHAEVEFLLAESAARGFDTPNTAREHYEAGILESHSFWGVTMDPAYLEHPDVAWDPARAKDLIGTQKWIALYNRGNEGYAAFRCFDWPVLSPPEDMTYSDIPMRMPYPYNEPDLNGVNYSAAASAIGGDKVGTLLFWDAIRSTETPAPGF